ncbi:MAG: hypothetical protein PHD67_00765 [Oscillospiraceae bacterium]|nr:hypothetical protein [Oscillospiraceae bacterium]
MKKILGLALAAVACLTTCICAWALDLESVDDFNDYIVAPGSIIDLEIDGDFSDKVNQRNQMRVKMDYDDGKSLVKSATIYRDDDDDYFVRIRLVEAEIMTPKELQATVIVSTSTSEVEGYIDTLVGYRETYTDKDSRSVSLAVDNESPVIVFDEYNTFASLYIRDQGEFQVKLTDQDAVNMRYSTDLIKEVEQAHEYATLRYLTFEGAPQFDYVGTMEIYANKGSYLYQYDGTKLAQVSTTYSGGALVFKTDALGCYVISDRALKNVDAAVQQPVETPAAESGETGANSGKVNPETGAGAAAAVLLAALAGASLLKK